MTDNAISKTTSAAVVVGAFAIAGGIYAYNRCTETPADAPTEHAGEQVDGERRGK